MGEGLSTDTSTPSTSLSSIQACHPELMVLADQRHFGEA